MNTNLVTTDYHQRILNTIESIAPMAKWKQVDVKFGTNFFSYLIDLIRSAFVTKGRLQSALHDFGRNVTEIKQQYPQEKIFPNAITNGKLNQNELQATVAKLNDLILFAEALVSNGALQSEKDRVDMQQHIHDLINIHRLVKNLEETKPSSHEPKTPLKEFQTIVNSHEKFLQQSHDILHKHLDESVLLSIGQMIDKNKQLQGRFLEKPMTMDMPIEHGSIRLQQALINELSRYLRMRGNPYELLDELEDENALDMSQFKMWDNNPNEQQLLQERIKKRHEAATRMERDFKSSCQQYVNILREFLANENSMTFDENLHFSRLFGELVEAYDEMLSSQGKGAIKEFINKSHEIVEEIKKLHNNSPDTTMLTSELEKLLPSKI